MAHKKHATEAEKEARIEMVVTLITQGIPVSSIRKRLVEAEDMSLKQAGRYINKAHERISLFGSKPIGLEKGMLSKRMEYLLSRAFLAKDHNLALEIMKSQVSLLQISYKYPQSGVEQSHDHSSAGPQSEQPGLEELLQLFEAEQSTTQSKRA